MADFDDALREVDLCQKILKEHLVGDAVMSYNLPQDLRCMQFALKEVRQILVTHIRRRARDAVYSVG